MKFSAFKMASDKYLKYTILVLVGVNVFCESVKDLSCVYETPGGKIDLGPLANNNNTARFSVVDQIGEYEYLWNPCFAFSDSYCQKAAVCQITIASRWFAFLAPQDGVIEKNTRGLPELQLVGVDPNDQFTRKTLITLICDPTQTDNFTFQGEEPIRTYHFTLISKYACVKPDSTTSHGPTGLLTTTAPPTSGPSPGPIPPIFSLATITILLAAILVCLCMLNCMVFMGLITRRPKQRRDNSTSGFTNHAFEKKPLN